MIRNRGQIHGVAADPKMKTGKVPAGLTAVIPALNRLTQADERFRAWVLEQYDEDDELIGSFADFDEARADWWSDMYDYSVEVVDLWVRARGVAPMHTT